jgi:hypothetical protein
MKLHIFLTNLCSEWYAVCLKQFCLEIIRLNHVINRHVSVKSTNIPKYFLVILYPSTVKVFVSTAHQYYVGLKLLLFTGLVKYNGINPES